MILNNYSKTKASDDACIYMEYFEMKAKLKQMCDGWHCRNPGSNQGPFDLQSNALPTELFRLPSALSMNDHIDFRYFVAIRFIEVKISIQTDDTK